MTELSLTERIVVEHFENGEAAPESYDLGPCTSFSHGTDGWHCVAIGAHEKHRNAAWSVWW